MALAEPRMLKAREAQQRAVFDSATSAYTQATYDEAKIEWSRLAWSSVDDAMCRYRIEKLAYGERPRKTN